MMKELLEKYNQVFDEKGEVKLCGRDKCKLLILECEKYDNLNLIYGNSETGMMNIDNIKKLINKNIKL